MADIQPGFTYSDVAGAPNNNLNAQNLHELVGNAVILPAFISAKALKSPAALSDAIVINDGGVLKYTTFQQLHDLILYPGSIVQTVYSVYTANTNISAVIPTDDTIPQNSEGTEIISVSITPRFSNSIIRARFSGYCSMDTASSALTVALFSAANVNAFAAMQQHGDTSTPDTRQSIYLEAYDSPATTSATIYSIRVGPNVGIARLNGGSSGRLFGGASSAYLIIEEIKQ